MKIHPLRKPLFYLYFVLLSFLLTAHRTVEGPTNHLYTATWSAAAADPGCGAAFLEALRKNPELKRWYINLPNQSVKNTVVKAFEAMFSDEYLRQNDYWLKRVSYYFITNPNRYSEFVNYFPLEKNKGRAKAYLLSLTDRKIYKGTVWRNQQSSLGYETFFNNGIPPKGGHDNLLLHTESNTTAGNFVSTTLDMDIAPQFGGPNGWVFEIRSRTGVDINQTLGDDALHFGQKEVSIPDGILPSDIIGVWKKQKRVLTEWIPNPKYIP